MVPAQLRNPHLGHELLRADRRLEHTAEEVGGRDRRTPAGPAMSISQSSASSDRRQVGRRIAVRQRAADRAAVPHLRVADQPCGVRHERVVLLQRAAHCHVVMARQRPDRDRVTCIADVRQLVEPPHVDEQCRPREPQPQQRQQRVPACEQLRVVALPSSGSRVRRTPRPRSRTERGSLPHLLGAHARFAPASRACRCR